MALARHNGPTALILTRQALPPIGGNEDGLSRGAYLLHEPADPEPLDMILVATGSEVHLAVEAACLLEQDGLKVRVVSMPCWELFEEQTPGYRNRVFPPGVPVLAVEAGSTQGWAAYTGRKEAVWGLDRFRSSGPTKDLFQRFGFTAAAVAKQARAVVAATIQPAI